jgi:hypothetical protein
MGNAQDLFLDQLNTKRDELQNLWWKIKDMSVQVNYWTAQKAMRKDALSLAFQAVRRGSGEKDLASVASNWLSVLGASGGGADMFTQLYYSNQPITEAYFYDANNYNVSGLEPAHMVTNDSFIAYKLRRFLDQIKYKYGIAIPPNIYPRYSGNIYIGVNEDDAYAAALNSELNLLAAAKKMQQQASLLSIKEDTSSMITGRIDAFRDIIGVDAYSLTAPDADLWTYIWTATEQKIRAWYKLVYSFAFSSRYLFLLLDSQKALIASYNSKLVSLMNFLDAAKANPELAAITPDFVSIKNQIEGQLKDPPVIPPVVIPPPAPAPQVFPPIILPIIAPKPSTDMVVTQNAPIPPVVEAKKKASLAPWIIAAGAAAYLLTK